VRDGTDKRGILHGDYILFCGCRACFLSIFMNKRDLGDNEARIDGIECCHDRDKTFLKGSEQLGKSNTNKPRRLRHS